MRLAVILALLPLPALACEEAPICLVSKDDVRLASVITFDDIPSSFGVGLPIDEVLARPGARFGERFAGQWLSEENGFDRVEGAAVAPVEVIAGEKLQSLGAMRLWGGTTVLQGHGPTGHPRDDAVGEGAIAVLFDRDQPALAFDIRGGEDGRAMVIFIDREGGVIHRMTLGPLKEDRYTFQRRGLIPDIAGFWIVNDDPAGLALDNLRFDAEDLLG